MIRSLAWSSSMPLVLAARNPYCGDLIEAMGGQVIRLGRGFLNVLDPGEALEGWSSPPTFDAKTGRETEPPGRGKFLIKVGGRPGIPVRVQLTEVEKATSDTNRLWRAIARVGQCAMEPEPVTAPLEPVTGLDLNADDDIADAGQGERP